MMAALDGQAGFTGVLAAALVASLDVAARILRDRCGTWSVSFPFPRHRQPTERQLLPPASSCEGAEFALTPGRRIAGDTYDYTLDHDTVHLTTLRLDRHGPSRTCHSHAGADR